MHIDAARRAAPLTRPGALYSPSAVVQRTTRRLGYPSAPSERRRHTRPVAVHAPHEDRVPLELAPPLDALALEAGAAVAAVLHGVNLARDAHRFPFALFLRGALGSTDQPSGHPIKRSHSVGVSFRSVAPWFAAGVAPRISVGACPSSRGRSCSSTRGAV